MTPKKSEKLKKPKKSKKNTPGIHALEKLKSQLRKMDPQGEFRITEPKPGDEKVSEVFIRFIEPLKQLEEEEEDFRNLAYIGMIAWNLGLLSPDERKNMMEQTFIYIGMNSIGQDMILLLYRMIERKETDFARYTQRITDIELVTGPSGRELSVAYIRGKE